MSLTEKLERKANEGLDSVFYADEEVLKAGWPQEDGFYKVVQVVIGRQPYLVFGKRYAGEEDVERELHKDIFAKLLSLKDIPIEGFNIIPSRKGLNYELVGAGVMQKKGNTYWYSGESAGYGIGINKQHLTAIQALNPDKKFVPK